MTDRNRPVVLLLCCLAQFMVVLDVAIVNVALPSIQHDLGISQPTLPWIVTAYGLMLGGFLLVGGRLADRWGRRRILTAGLIVFTGASVAAGLVDSSAGLIVARAVQGLGGAMIPPAALAILAVTFAEGPERNKALGIYGATTGMSASVGVLASGLLTSGPGWRWIFFINLPIGLALVAVAALFLPAEGREEHRDAPINARGALIVTAALVLLVFGVSRSAVHGWGAADSILPIAVGAVVLLVFIDLERRSAIPFIPRAALRNSSLVRANLASFLLFGGIFASIFLGSLYMQRGFGYTPTRTGLAWLATTITSFVAAASTGTKLVGILGPRRLIVAGFSCLGLAALLFMHVPPHPRYVTDLMPILMLSGLAGGLAAPAIQIAALTGVPAELSGLAGGTVETMREIGGAVNIAIVATILASHSVGLGAFHQAYWAVFGAAVLGVLTTVAGMRPYAGPPDAVFEARQGGLSTLP